MYNDWTVYLWIAWLTQIAAIAVWLSEPSPMATVAGLLIISAANWGWALLCATDEIKHQPDNEWAELRWYRESFE